MKTGILLMIVTALLFVGCRSVALPKNNAPVTESAKLPQFDALDSDGNRIESNQLAYKTVVVAFFDPESVLAWRTLSKIAQTFGKAPISIIGIAGAKAESGESVNISSLKGEYQIAFPLILDKDNHLSKSFGAPSCCDYLYVYDSVGKLRSSQRLSESYNNLGSSIAELTGDPSVTGGSELAKERELYSGLRINSKQNVTEPLPIASSGVTVVNLFDEFCTECTSGSRFQTLRRLGRIPGSAGRIVAVFSKANFSVADIENFKLILPTSFSLTQGDIEAARPYLVAGKLLVVFDSKKSLIWRERADMTEPEIFAEVSNLLRSANQ